ncbi:MAG: class I SAM-dependent methyltransferase [Pseudomonadota bacterium]
MLKLPIDVRIAALSLLPKRGVGVEIGVHEGRFSRLILRHAAPSKLFLVDPWMCASEGAQTASHYGAKHADQAKMDERYEGVCRAMADPVRNGRVEILRKTSVDAAADFEDGSLDFVYIDGDHAYDAVVKDLALYYPKVKKGGYIIGDDYMGGYWWGDGVIRAFHEFLAANPVEIEAKLGEQIVVKV